MESNCSRRCFLKVTAAAVASQSILFTLPASAAATDPSADLIAQLGPKSKIRVGKVYVGLPHAGWPGPTQDINANVSQFEQHLARMAGLEDIEFVNCGLVSNAEQLAAAKAKLDNVTGILAIHLSGGTGGLLDGLMATGLPVMIFTLPYSGHEWHIVASWQRQGKRIEVLPSSRYEDIAAAIRPFRALQRLKEARILHVSTAEANPQYVQAIKEKFGTEIISLNLSQLEEAYQKADPAAAEADAKLWCRQAHKMVEPKHEDILKGSTMFIAMKDLLARHQAQAITMNCLGMGLIDRKMGYPCLGFVRLNNALLAGVCEADLKSSMTQLIFTWLVGRTGFVTDPCFDYSTSTILHAHCVAATRMLGPQSRPSPYDIRSHLEDNRGASLQVKLPTGRKVSMARLIGPDVMLFSTGDAIDSPFVERGCRTKLTVRVENIEKFVANWSSGLHRVIFYGDHSHDLARFCRLAGLRLLREGVDDLHDAPGLEWQPHVHA